MKISTASGHYIRVMTGILHMVTGIVSGWRTHTGRESGKESNRHKQRRFSFPPNKRHIKKNWIRFRIPEDEKREILDYISSIAEKKPDYMENNITSMNIG